MGTTTAWRRRGSHFPQGTLFASGTMWHGGGRSPSSSLCSSYQNQAPMVPLCNFSCANRRVWTWPTLSTILMEMDRLRPHLPGKSPERQVPFQSRLPGVWRGPGSPTLRAGSGRFAALGHPLSGQPLAGWRPLPYHPNGVVWTLP